MKRLIRLTRRHGRYRARRFPSRYIKRTGGVRRRIMRNALARRPHRPEVKYIDLYQAGTLTTLSAYNTNVTAEVVAIGAGEGQRVGNSINLRKVKIKLDVMGPTITTGSTNEYPDGYVRVVFWTPRIDYANALSYMNTVNYSAIIDFNAVTVIRDMYVHVSNTYKTAPYQSQSGAVPCDMHYELTFPFPRKARFAPSGTGLTTLDVDKDVMYVMFYSDFMTSTASFQMNARLLYTDA